MKNKFISRKVSIIISAIDILAEKGIQGMTMKEIAKMEGVTEPAIYRQYKGKKDVIVAILDEFARYDDQIIATVAQQKLNSKEAIEFFCSSLADYYQGYPEVATVMFSLDVFKYATETNEKMEAIIQKRFDFLEKYVNAGLEEGIFSVNMDSDILVDMIYGFIMNTTFNWKSKKRTYDLKKRVLKMLECIFVG